MLRLRGDIFPDYDPERFLDCLGAHATIERIEAVSGRQLISFADRFRARLKARGTATVIPNNPTRVTRYPIDRALYKERHLVECFFNKVKHFRRLATRYDKTARAYLAFFAIAATMIWLR